MNSIKVADYDVIFLSYDEPNAEKNYADLCSKIPWAKRVHGVEGSDAAHKACADLSETDRFITVDADNIVYANYIQQIVNFKPEAQLDHSVVSWCGKNVINGLVYGNGGLKCWPKSYVLNMRTHENAEPGNPQGQVDFCWDMRYIQMNTTFSDVYNNATPQQAWRAGFREGVKMALDQGVKPDTSKLYDGYWQNLHRLYIWQMIGADVENGLWAIYGAREGLYRTMCTDWNFVNVRDFTYLNNLWNTEVSKIADDDLVNHIEDIGRLLIKELDIPISESPLSDQQSKFFKTVYQVPKKINKEPFLIEDSNDT